MPSTPLRTLVSLGSEPTWWWCFNLDLAFNEISHPLKEVDTTILEDMARAPNDTIEKITQILAKQREMLKQMGTHLSCLEEGIRKLIMTRMGRWTR